MKVIVIVILIGELGTISKRWLEECEIGGQEETI